MAGIDENDQWTNEVYQLETTDPVQGGVDGIDNVPHKALANRTKWLKAQVALKALLGGSATQFFKVKAGVSDNDAINKKQLEDTLATIEGVPTGVITMWSGAVSSVPDGWYLCNGSNGTPDLRNRFVYGASVDQDVKNIGGSANAVNVSHSHSGSSNSAGSHYHNISSNNGAAGGAGRVTNNTGSHLRYTATSSSGNHSHAITVNSSGENGVNKNLPPYMKLAYIMKG